MSSQKNSKGANTGGMTALKIGSRVRCTDDGIEDLLRDEDFSKGAFLVEHPGVQGGDEGVAVEEVHLQGQDTEKQVAIGVGDRHGSIPPVRKMG
jgi:hypothetical protein